MNNKFYPLYEIIYTIQGEGFFAGTPAVFVRLGGCDVGCHWCDIKNSWDKNLYPQKSTKEIINEIKKFNTKTVVITGGEPLIYELSDLTCFLKNEGYKIHLETSGAYPLSGTFDWVCFSPKKFKKPDNNFGKNANELKVVIYNKTDFAWAEEIKKTVNSECKLYLQPEWGKREKNNKLIIEYIKKNTEWKISLQTHKYLDIP